MVRRRLLYRGTVQGVGFRPAVYRAAAGLGLQGFVQNLRSEVAVEVQGSEAVVEAFPHALARALPSAARIERVSSSAVQVLGAEAPGFRILESGSSPYSFPPVPPDLALCADCRRELLDPADRRYLYPLITCTQCGPRYSILLETPFDRVRTSMQPFPQCPLCLREYADPGDRRFHSQTNSCPACGPRISCTDGKGAEAPGDPLQAAVLALSRGEVVAVQGIGGFHLAADPACGAAMQRLRAVKSRVRKPFALMVRNLEEARALCELTGEEERLLASPESPIVIAARRASAPAHLQAVSDTDTLGIMLPSTPLHVLLFELPGAAPARGHLVMTSGNRVNEPIVADPGEAREVLGGTASRFLAHDRRIVARVDDSIARSSARAGTYLLRRSRGYVPRLIGLSLPVEGVVLALGGDLKSAPSLARGTDVHLSPYLGDLEDPSALALFEAQLRAMQEMYGVAPDRIVHDLHPGYFSTRWVEREEAASRARGGHFPARIAVQHHFAHVLSVMAEHGLEEAIGLAFDGTGHGTDGVTWGGEFLHATRSGFTRLGHLAPFGLPGGEAAVRNPARIACAILGPRADLAGRLDGLEGQELALVGSMVEKGLNCPPCTSMGRLFDAAAAVLGLVKEVSYEGEGPIRLEGAALRARRGAREALRLPLDEEEALHLLPFSEGFSIDARPLIVRMIEEHGTRPVEEAALRFHEAIAFASLQGARRMRAATGIGEIALSGGVFQNLLLREQLIPLLRREGFRVYLNEKAPPGDGGISVGQAWFAPKPR